MQRNGIRPGLPAAAPHGQSGVSAMAGNAATSFFTARWRREVPLDRLLWVDMILVGSAINLVTTFVALMMLGFKAPTVVAIATHFAALPYNAFLFAAVWRTAIIARPSYAMTAQTMAVGWFVLAAVL
jgi:hypothetical protein